MTKFNTGNPVGSADPRDLHDSAVVADNLVNGQNESYPDRLGKSRKSWAGVEAQVATQESEFNAAQSQRASDFAADQSSRETTFTNFLNSSGFEYLGTYAAGIEFTEYNQYVVDGGEAWFPDLNTALPYTTTGAGLPEGGNLMSRGEALLRQELGSGVRRVDSLAGLQSISGRFSGDGAYLMGRTTAGDGGQGEFRWDGADLSGTLVTATLPTESVDDTTDTITDTAHGLVDGDGVTVDTTVNGLTANELYWVVGATTDTYQLSTDFGGSPVDLTGTTNFTTYKLLDPLQGVYVVSDRTGASGAWARQVDDALNIEWFGAIGDGSTDNTAAIQKCIDYPQSKVVIPSGVYNHSGISLSPSVSNNLEGHAYDPDASAGSVLVNTNVSGGHGITVDNTPFSGNFDKQIRLTNLTIKGNPSSGDGINCDQAMLFLENVWITGNGRHGLYAQRCYSSAFRQVSFSNNSQHGFLGTRALNAVHFDHCLFNGNSTVTGYSGCQLTGASGADRNFGVTFTSCDFTGNGETLGGGDTAYGLVVQYSSGVNVLGCYGEGNLSYNLYADNTVSGLNILGGFWQDSTVLLSRVNGLVFLGNEIYDSGSAITTLNIDGGLPDVRAPLSIGGTTYTGTVSKVFAGGASDSSDFVYSGLPTSGQWQKGDFIKNDDANGGGVLGWICTVSGSPGTWLPTNQIPQVFANHGDADATLIPLSSFPSNYWRSPLTANRTVTLSSTNAFSGCRFRVTRSAGATGSFDLNVGGLKILAAGEWCDVEYDGSAWVLSAYGTL
jgi:hypothetical protein